jgi:homocysteine S-methyltransferase
MPNLNQFVKDITNPDDKTIYVLDGGQGTYLENNGINVNSQIWCSIPFTKSEFWDTSSEKSHERVIMEKMFKDFLHSGCNMVMTPTYQLNYSSYLKELDLNRNVESLAEYNALLDKISAFTREQANTKDNILVVGSIGCYGSMILAEFTGDYGSNPESIDYMAHYKPQLDNFIKSDDIDVIIFETVPNIEDLKFLLSLGEDYLNKPFFIGLSTNDKQQLRDGTPLKEVSELFNELKKQGKLNKNLILLGCNCCSFESSTKSIGELKANLDFYIGLISYPNSGEIYDTVTKEWHKPKSNLALSENNWQSSVDSYISNGCRVIGGCCRTTPEDIKCIYEAINN